MWMNRSQKRDLMRDVGASNMADHLETKDGLCVRLADSISNRPDDHVSDRKNAIYPTKPADYFVCSLKLIIGGGRGV